MPCAEGGPNERGTGPEEGKTVVPGQKTGKTGPERTGGAQSGPKITKTGLKRTPKASKLRTGV